MNRSGSTWLYNVLRVILSDFCVKESWKFNSGWIEDIELIDSDESVDLIKLHKFDCSLAARADFIFYSFRDIRDVLASLKRKFNSEPSVKKAEFLLKEDKDWKGVSDYSMRYEDMLADPEKVVLQVSQALNVACNQPEKILDNIKGLSYESEGKKNHLYNKVNLFHAGHITNGGTHTWENDVPKSVIDEIEKRFSHWLKENHY